MGTRYQCIICWSYTIPSNTNGFGTIVNKQSDNEPYHSCPNSCIRFVSTSLLKSAMKRVKANYLNKRKYLMENPITNPITKKTHPLQ